MDDNLMLNRKFNKDLKIKYKLYFQIEHNLVLKGGRDVINNNLYGNVISIFNNKEKYLVRIVDLDKYKDYDYIIEYSLPNIENIKLSNYFDKNFINKILYLPPLIFDYINYKPIRNINILTTFIDKEQPRRKKLLNDLDKNNINYQNINNIFNKNKLLKIYDNTKILINIHQTDFHHTLEEFRILPALSRNIVIISENIPLKYIIPYNEYIIWCDYSNIINTLKEVELNYDKYFNNFFENNNLKYILKNLEDNALNIINNKCLL
jgi:hypothetical protein